MHSNLNKKLGVVVVALAFVLITLGSSIQVGTVVTTTSLQTAAPLICPDLNASHTGGAGVEFVCNTSPSYTPAAGSIVLFRFAAAGNAAGPNINVNGSGIKAILSPDGGFGPVSAQAANGMQGDAGVGGVPSYYLMIYNGTNWILYQNTPTPNAASIATSSPTANGLVTSQGTGGGEGTGLLSVLTGCTASNTTITCTGSGSFGGLSATGGKVIQSAGGVAPTLSAGCNGAGSSVLAGSTNNRGQFTTQNAAVTTCTLSFSASGAWAQTPFCVFTDGGASITPVAFSAGAISTSTAVVDFVSASNKVINYVCM